MFVKYSFFVDKSVFLVDNFFILGITIKVYNNLVVKYFN